MKKIFRKAITVLGSAALIGATIGAAAAAAYPMPFTAGNTAIVVGANAAPLDVAGMGLIEDAINSASMGDAMTTLEGAEGITEDEVVLGSLINATGYKIETIMTDSKISTLLDQKISWDDGDGSDDYDIHEEIVINGNMNVLTSLDDEDLTGVALSNNMALEYRYVFDDAIPIAASTAADADDLYLTILGQSYEIMNMTATTISVVTSEEISVRIGESVTVQGKTYTVDDLSTTSARINGVTVAEGTSKKIDGLQVEVDAGSIFYNENFPEQASLTLKIGEDISKTYSDGDEYIGEDEDDPLWVWTISDPTSTDGYIGVAYNVNINDADDDDAGDTIKYEGAGYILPENFAEVRLDGLTDVDYEKITIKFEDKDLYNSSDEGSANENAKVIVISAETTSTITVGGKETDEIYIYYAGYEDGTEDDYYSGTIEIFYRDHDGDNTPTNKARYRTAVGNFTDNQTLDETEIATIEVGDTDMSVLATVAGGIMTLSFKNSNEGYINLTVGGTGELITSVGVGRFVQLGETLEDADPSDIVVGGNDVSTKEESIMDYYGTIVAEDDSSGAEGNADEDEVTLSIPSDQVFAIVSVVAGGEASTTTEAGVMTVLDTAVSTVSGKNLIVVGGSAINSVAADLLGGTYSEAAFTSATGIGAGQFLIESFDRSGKIALLVAGYEAADTQNAVTYLLNEDVDTTVGVKKIGTSATEATIV